MKLFEKAQRLIAIKNAKKIIEALRKAGAYEQADILQQALDKDLEKDSENV